MNVQINVEDMDLTPDIGRVLQEKFIVKIEKYLTNFNEDIKTASIRIKKGSRWGYRINFSLYLPEKKHIFAEEKHEDLAVAITQLEKEITRQIREYKERITRKRSVVSYS